ncbi:hypothetical protein SAMN05421771_0461 [Granulicella pectinivorans]|jgi:hypothetical protein|uniref:Uncharacterized protein n=1 Tax=Granulicella pectinivorans TaxID=474950 RepID=A0A1I6L9S2_9BACT|nr:hypothetical protein [Granulicella pectinivorans]SFS00216.1 hypothetical protein SAMN05421771_0461 [Granulicella pectinivorans]
MGREILSDQHYFEISGRFRDAVLARIERLERDAHEDSLLIADLLSPAHQRRQAQLVAAQIEEAVRLRACLCGTSVTVQSIHKVLTRGD